MMIRNAFFDLALKKAAGLLGRRARMLVLVGRLAARLKDVRWSEVKTEGVREKLFMIGRLFRAYALGQYRSVPWKAMLLVTATILYFISPFDAIPDLIPGLGFTDDFAILLAVYNALHGELEKFAEWEKMQLSKL